MPGEKLIADGARWLWEKLIDYLMTPKGGVGIVSEITATGYSADDEEREKREAIVAFARAQIGEPYVFGAEGPADQDLDRWDCSELVEHAYRAAGLVIPDGSRYQRDFCQRVREPRAGDLAYYEPNANGIGHIEIYEGDGLIIGARSRKLHGQQVGKVQRLARMDAEGHERFGGWYRHPDFARPLEDRI